MTDEQAEEICGVDELSNFLIEHEQAFKHTYWPSIACQVARDDSVCKLMSNADLRALMFLSADRGVVMACRDELRERFFKRNDKPAREVISGVRAALGSLSIRGNS